MYVLTRNLEKVAYVDQQYVAPSGGGGTGTAGALVGGGAVGAAAYGIHKFKKNQMLAKHTAELANQAATHADDIAKATGPMAHIKNFVSGAARGLGEGIGGGATAEALKNPKVKGVVNSVDEALNGKGRFAAEPKVNSVYGDFNPNVNKAPKAPWRQRMGEAIAGKKFVSPDDIAAMPKNTANVDEAVAAGRRFGAKVVQGAEKYGPKAAEATVNAAKGAASATVNAAKGAAKATGGAAETAANFVKEKASAAAAAFKPKPKFTETVAAGAKSIFKTVRKYGNIFRKVASQLEEIKMAAYNDEMNKLINK
jgi:hypothetical protein